MSTVKYLDENGLGTVWTKVKGIVTPKADKVSSATNGHLAGLNASGNLTDSGVVASNVALKDGSYSQMTVGTAEDLASTQSVASEFTYRVTGGSTSVGKGGTAIVDRIKGRTVVYNQLVFNGNFKAQTGWGNPAGGTVTFVPDGISIAFATRNTYTGQTGRTIVSGHKYYMSAVYNQPANTATNIVLRDSTAGTGNFITMNSTSYGSFIRVEQIGTAITTGNHEVRIINSYDGANTTVVKYIELIDLTLMFGSGNEPATTAEFDALYPLPYYEYTLVGKLVNNGVQTERDLLWNQLVSNGNFSNGTTGWSAYNSTLSAGNGELTITKSNTVSGLGGLAETQITGNTAHYYYIACDAKCDSADTGMFFGFHTSSHTIGSNIMVTNGTSTYCRLSFITKPANATDSLCARIGIGASAVGVSGKIKNVIMCDLTAMFGAGNEPASTTEFEDMFPNPYYPYDAGTSQSFHFPQFETGLKTVGFNLWDEEWETGTYNTETGAKVSGSTQLRCKNKIPVFPSTNYYIKTPEATRVLFYDAGEGFIGIHSQATGITNFTTPSNCRYIAFHISANYGTQYKNDVCINISDTSRNGTYEPHWEETAALNLGDFKVKSPNIWDEEWEVGAFDTSTGQKKTADNTIRSKNYIKVLPSTTYYASLAPKIASVYYYDANYSFISFDYNASGVRTTPNGCYYMMFVGTSTYGTTYANDICICESGHGHDGKYYPYGALTIQGGLKSAGTAYDEISGGKFIQRVGEKDMGSIVWTSAGSGRMYSNDLADKPAGYNLICQKYITYQGTFSWGDSVDKMIGGNQSSTYAHRIYVQDYAYTDFEAFKASLSGVPLYYELATPEDFELLTPIDTAIRNDPYGTEERIPADTAGTVLAPFRADITYSTNIKEAVEHLDENFISTASMTDFLTALNEQMNGTWSMIFQDGRYRFSFTPNPEQQATL